MTIKRNILLSFILVAAITAISHAGQVIYVDADATGPTHDGSSWCNGYTELYRALAIATSGDEIRIACGTYKPRGGGPNDPRENSFDVPSGVRLLGGYAGCGEPNPNTRDISVFTTTLTGDRLGDDGPNFTNRDDNHFHVIKLLPFGDDVLVDGFHITAGNAQGELGDWMNRTGGGVFTQYGNPIIRDVTFSSHDAIANGAALFLSGSTVRLERVHIFSCRGPALNGGSSLLVVENSLFVGNTGGGLKGTRAVQVNNSIFAYNGGPAIQNTNSSPPPISFVRNSTIVANSWDNSVGAGIFSPTSEIEVTNTILWGNEAQGDSIQNSQIFVFQDSPTINYSCVMGWDGSLGGTGNIGSDPQIGTINEDILETINNIKLNPWSPCINAGDPADTLQLGERDLDGNARVMCGRIDIGANEFGFGDITCDGLVNIDDYAQWDECVVEPTAGCESLDFEFDGDTDLADFHEFQLAFEPEPDAFATYRLTFDATWSNQTHPTSFPPGPHFSSLIGGTHNENYVMWEDGGIASPGIESMAETGGTFTLRNEIQAQINAGNAAQIIPGGNIGVSPGITVVEFTVVQEFPLFSMVTMIAPSPDWFVGVDRVELFRNNHWVDELVIPLQPYDSGTDSGLNYTSSNADITPHIPITELTGFPFVVGNSVPPLGTFTIERID